MRLRRVALVLLGLGAVPHSRLEAQRPSSEFSSWASVGIGVASPHDLLWHGSLWWAPRFVAVGLRQSGRSVPSLDAPRETSVLLGLRPQREHSTAVLAAGIALQKGWTPSQPSCFGCNDQREFFTGEAAPILVVEFTSDEGRMGLGLSLTAAAGRHAYVGLSAILRVAFLDRNP